MSIRLSVIIPTRERASYLLHAIRTCTGSSARDDVEILVLDNASTDDTAQVVASFDDPRIRYERSQTRLSMRDNFERGLQLARGDVLCCIGDDDGLMPGAIEQVFEIFSSYPVDAVSAARAHYFWPDLVSPRHNTGLLPRRQGVRVLDTRAELYTLLDDADYYRLPCLYHGFVKRAVVDRIAARQSRFFLSSQVDMYSAIAISCENIRYAYSLAPLVINGGSKRSNGASHFGGGTEQEKALWKKEDDIGFLPGFAGAITIPALIIESGLRHVAAHPELARTPLFEPGSLTRALAGEARARRAAGRPEREILDMYSTSGVTLDAVETAKSAGPGRVPKRLLRLFASYFENMPVDFDRLDIDNVNDASRYFGSTLAADRVGLLADPLAQFRTSLRILRS